MLRRFSTVPTKQIKVTLERIRKLYAANEPIIMMTAHDYPSGLFCQESGTEICLVGDSLAMVALGHDSTLQITLDEMIHHSRSVKRSCTIPFLVGDLPFGSYELSPDQACASAIRFVKEGMVEAVKLEGGAEMAETVKKISSIGIPVLGHIGLTPQRASALSGFRAQGRTMEKAKLLMKDAMAIQNAGAFAIVLEAIPELVATEITKSLNIPTIGIGAGPQTSGQVLVQLDALGVYDKLQPKFSKVYETIGRKSIEALKRYGEEVKQRSFPVSGQNTYTMAKGEEELFKEWLKTHS